MLQGMLQIRRSMAVAAISGVLIFGSLIGAGLSLWAKHGSSSSQLPAVVLAAEKNVEAVPPNALGFAPVLKPALAAVVNISSSRIVKTPSAPSGPFSRIRSFASSLVTSSSVRCRASNASTAWFRRHGK
jgi:hypothetical protein